MADPTAIEQAEQAISDILNATEEFKSGTPYYRRAIGSCPSFMVWWDGFTGTEREGDVKPGPHVRTHRFQIELYSLMGANEEDGNKRFKALVKTACDALEANPRLNGKCLRSRIVTGQADLWMEKGTGSGNLYLQMIMFLEADMFGAW